MKILLDTNVFLRLFLSPSHISPDVETLLKDSQNEIFLSAVSAWEFAVKYGINKLKLPDAPEIYVPDRMKRANLSVWKSHRNTLWRLQVSRKYIKTRLIACWFARQIPRI